MFTEVTITMTYFRLCCLDSLLEGSMESSRRLYPVLAGLQSVAILEHAASAKR